MAAIFAIMATPSSEPAATTDKGAIHYTPETYAAENSYGFLLRRLLGSLQRHLDRRLQPLDLTALQLGPLVLLSTHQGHTAAQLARCLNIDTGAMTRMLDRLEAKGHIARVRSQADRRVVLLELTASGKTLVETNAHLLIDVLNLHLEGFSAPELALFMQFMQRMLDNGARMDAEDARE